MSVQMSGTFPPQQGTSNYANASQQPGPYPNMGMMPGQQGRPFANAMNTMSMPINAPPGMSMPPGVGRSQPMNVNTSSIPNKMMAPPPGMTTMNPNMMQQRSMAPPPQTSNTPPTSSSASSSSASKFPSMSGGYSDMMGMYNKGPGPASYTQAVLTMQQQQPQMKPPVLSKQQQQQQQESEFSLVTEDFPALPGYKESGGGGQQQQSQQQQQQQQNFYNQQQQFKAMSQQQQGGQQQQQQNYVMNEPPRNMSSYEQFLIQRQQQQQQGGQQQQQTPQQMPPNQQQQQQQQKKQFVPDRYGLLGLLSVIRMIDADLNTLALGTELTTLGLNLNSPDCLYSTFASPWAEGPSRREPEYYIPMCYYTPNPLQSPFLRMNLYSEETLLYIFYSMPRDMLQIAAASELHRRDWRYHKEHKLWLTRAPNTEPTQKTPTFERGSYIFFDTTSWDKVRKDNFVLMYDQIEPPSNAATNVMNNATSTAVSSNPQVVV